MINGLLYWPDLLRWLLGGSGLSMPLLLAWYLATRRLSLDRDRQRASTASGAVDGLVQFSGALQAEITKLKIEITRYSAEIEVLRAARWTVDEVLLDLHSSALAARAMVHDLQRSAGLPETVFPALPEPAWSALHRRGEPSVARQNID
jgi:hypothetical protein